MGGALRRMSADGDRAVRVHAHFAHDPALVGLLLARLTGLPYSFTGHARDLLQIPAESLAARATAATALVTCCTANADYIAATVPRTSLPPVFVIHYGVELGRFVFADHRSDAPPVPEPRLVSVGRLVEKKGFADLLHALARLADDGQEFRCRLYGEGPLLGELTALRDALGLADRVELMGPASSDQIVAALASADAFVLTPRVTADGDRDGIPNVLVEAMACGLPVVTTSAGGITELVHDDVNGLVCAPGDVAGIAGALRRLLCDPRLRGRLATVARRTVEDGYDVDDAARRLEGLLLERVPAGTGAVG
ncbi:MAG: glycosyltransferase family 4 protein [Actinomycetota bacterium]|nr:glycosyltransferase family 4 protein [Actinomycetota bacterium]